MTRKGLTTLRSWMIGVLCLVATPLAADICYDVTFVGVSDPETLKVLRTVSQSIALEESPPVSETALRRRAEADIPRLVQGLHTLAFYDAEVTVDVDTTRSPALVIFRVQTGPTFPLVAFHLLHVGDIGSKGPELKEEPQDEDIDWLDEQGVSKPQANHDDPFIDYGEVDLLEDLGVELGTPAYPEVILSAEEAILDWLASQGYPVASVAKRDVIADQLDKTVQVWLYIDSGPLAYFGDTAITGLKRVCERLVRRKIAWCEGDIFSPELIDATLCALEKTALFTSIEINPAEDEPDESALLPMNIELREARHRTIGFGATYATEPGAGVIAEWETRNFRGMGERLSVKGEVAQKLQAGVINYVKPEFICPDQDLIAKVEANHEITKGFHESSVSGLTRVRKKLNPYTYISSGVGLKYLLSEKSDNNRHFTLLSLPQQLLWNNTECILDPTSGASLNARITPTFGLESPSITYYTATADMAFYYPFDEEHHFVLATKVSLGSILGASRISIPPPERFYAGSAQLLRGYRFLTVSPLGPDNKPIGGRSLMVYSFEFRQRWCEDWGSVVFYEIGNVYATTNPEFNHKQLQSVGVGIRYFTAVGPLRLDVALPLNRRPGIDQAFQVYFSVGQTF